ncbi:alkaline phosphatase family protein [Fredinandcohnia sp. 179-A 10B2 NHS]|uniref:alkaline phosphatase family protein n=1 Tax=Fredinandcohnia sp. 179-A 10B2 NHS TaxID=3235176 RepID=UPI00399FBBD4
MAKVISSIVILSFLLAFGYMFLIHSPKKITKQNHVSVESSSKPVVMVIIDSIMDEPMQSAISNGKAPALEFLMKNGYYYPSMISSYPTMSVAIDSTLLTGTYPDQHKVPALVWFDEKEQRLVSYGSAWKEIAKLGVKQVMRDSILNLNQRHLSMNVKTIHEELGLQSSSINTLVYRGSHSRQLNVPRLFKYLGYLNENEEVPAPNYFSYGLLSKNDPDNKYTHFWQAFGFTDRFATKELTYLIQQDTLPSYSLVYLSDNDKQVHKKGVYVTKGIEEADKHLQELLNLYSSCEEAIEKNTWVVMGDSGQTYIKNNKKEALIDLRKLLDTFKIHKIGEPVQNNDQIVLGLNERMSFIYLLDKEISAEDILKLLKEDSRLDVMAWKEGKQVIVSKSGISGTLTFQPGGEYIDQYGQSWSIDGNEKIMDLVLQENEILYGDYPDGLARLYSSFFSHSGTFLIVNAKPGYEFIGEGSPRHVGGASHGSLHKDDSHFPMIVAGTNIEPKHQRMVDLKEWVLRLVKDKEALK